LEEFGDLSGHQGWIFFGKHPAVIAGDIGIDQVGVGLDPCPFFNIHPAIGCVPGPDPDDVLNMALGPGLDFFIDQLVVAAQQADKNTNDEQNDHDADIDEIMGPNPAPFPVLSRPTKKHPTPPCSAAAIFPVAQILLLPSPIPCSPTVLAARHFRQIISCLSEQY